MPMGGQGLSLCRQGGVIWETNETASVHTGGPQTARRGLGCQGQQQSPPLGSEDPRRPANTGIKRHVEIEKVLRSDIFSYLYLFFCCYGEEGF